MAEQFQPKLGLLASTLLGLTYEDMREFADYVCGAANDWADDHAKDTGSTFDEGYFPAIILDWARDHTPEGGAS